MRWKCDGDEIKLCYKEDIERLRNRYHHQSSSHAFSSLYLWRNPMGLTLYLEGEMFAVKSKWRGENAWFFPCGEKQAIIDFIKKHKSEEGFKLFYARQEDIQLLNQYFPQEFSFREDFASSEYIYDKEGHRTLSGKKYANLRTQLHKVEREHLLRTKPLSEETLSDAINIVKNWQGKKHSESILEIKEDEKIEEEGLSSFRELEICGVVIYMDGQPYAVAAGYPLSSNCYDLFLAKERERISGLAYYAKREFFLSLPDQYRYINIEEDLGIEGLRKMKKILNPVNMNQMWEAVGCQR